MTEHALSIDRDYLTTTLQDLVRINSVNPSLVPAAPGEVEIADHVARACEALGLEVAVHEPQAGRPSVIGRLPGSGGGRSLMLNAHLDTVGVEDMEAPFSAEVRDGRLYGRGSYDMKGSLAACLAAVKALGDSGTVLRGDLLVAGVADEEHESIGTADLIDRCPVDGAIVTEPSELKLCIAHRGFTWLEVTTEGRAAHGSKFKEGIDANLRMGRFLTRTEELERELREREGHPLLGPPSLHAATLQGGSGLSTYAAHSVCQIERRTIPPESQNQVETEITNILTELRSEDPHLKISSRTLLHREPFETTPEAPVVRSVVVAAATVLGEAPPLVGESPWMDSAFLASAGVDTVVFGPSGAGAHAAVEWVDLDSVQRTAEVLAHAAIDYCGVND
jgi:acetylornithine deacetylase